MDSSDRRLEGGVRTPAVANGSPAPASPILPEPPPVLSVELRCALARRILCAEGLEGDRVQAVAAALAGAVDGIDLVLRPLVGPYRFQTLLTGATLAAATSHLTLCRSLPRRGDLGDESHLRSLLDGCDRPLDAALVLLAELLEKVARLLGGEPTLVLLAERWSEVVPPYPPGTLPSPAPDFGPRARAS